VVGGTLLLALVAVLYAALALLPGAHRTSADRAGRGASRGALGNVELPKPTKRPSRYAVGMLVRRYVEPGRTVTYANGLSEPRSLLTYIRYPALGPPGATELAGAVPADVDGPFPLIVFGHGFDESPNFYSRLLNDWAHEGFIVAAPEFPLERPNAPGGPQRADLINEPADVRFLISRLLGESAASNGPLAGLIDPSRVAVAGQSDGGDVALALGYDHYDREPLVKAVVVLSGAELPGLAGFEFPPGSPPLFGAQGTADKINSPQETEEYFNAAGDPKYLLTLIGAEHLPPYSSEEPQLSIVARTSADFLHGYLENKPAELRKMEEAAEDPGISSLTADP
jgi:fermentation-respiration switch protein FrsA (DUF1100 family)